MPEFDCSGQLFGASVGVDDREHFLLDGFSGGKQLTAESGGRDHGLT